MKTKIAVLGLSPYARGNGLIGDEKKSKILLVIKKLFYESVLVFDLYAADSFFGSNKYRNFDAILAMYHDQGF